MRFKTRSAAFTLIELLVVISIIAILAALLFPVFARAKEAGKKTVCLSNSRQIAAATAMYVQDYERFPVHSSPSSTSPRIRWPDLVHPYAKNEQIFICPVAPLDVLGKPWAHNQQRRYGGFGYNYQYLGNARFPWAPTESELLAPAETVLFGDTRGVRRANGTVSGGEYVIDPPLPSLRGSGRPEGFYGTGAECGEGFAGCRSTPHERHSEFIVFGFADGHSKAMKLSQVDDYDRNGEPDNGYWNGLADPSRR